MLAHGDELGRTQQGNNNVYCQDSELSWIDWESADTELLEFTQKVSALRSAHPVFRRRRFFNGRPVRRPGEPRLPDIGWYAPDGSEMTDEDWDAGYAKSMAVYLNGQGIPDRDERGQRIVDDSFYMCFNAHYEPIEFVLPPSDFAEQWVEVINTAADCGTDPIEAGTRVTVESRAMLVLQAHHD